MFKRHFQLPDQLNQSVFIFGPRGTGKTSWLSAHYPSALYFDLLNDDHYRRLLARPNRLESLIPSQHTGWVIIDEIQKIPELLNNASNWVDSVTNNFVKNTLYFKLLMILLQPITASHP